jgi:FixJ family two-component response regulator
MTDRAPDFVVAVVDDDQGILRSLEILLESADYAGVSGFLCAEGG